MELNNTTIKNKFISENFKINNKIKKYSKIIEVEEEDKLNFIESFNKIKHRLSENDIKNINNWDSYKKKNFIIPNKRLKNKKKPLNISSKWYIYILNNLKEFNSNPTFFNFGLGLLKIDDLYNKFLQINIKKINKINKINYFDNSRVIYIDINLKRLKSIITVRLFNKQILTLSNGLMFKKLNLNHKKYKKSMKITFLVVKNVVKKLNFLLNFKIVYVYIKGLSFISNKVVEYMNKNIEINNKDTKKIYINSYKIANNSFFKFKKVKAIKRRLKKKNLKLN